MANSDPGKKRRKLGRDGEHPRGDLGQLIFLGVFLTVWILDSFVFRLSTVPPRSLPLGARLAAAGAILFLAVALAGKGHIVISEETLRRGRLVKDGMFARVRHPLYLAALLIYLALAVTTVSLASLAVLAAIFVFYDIIAAYEEDFLLRKYGREYGDYLRKVRRWVPRLRPAVFD
jgi:protein-S-isoprenylcysteine O-methyltransferase Ste14